MNTPLTSQKLRRLSPAFCLVLVYAATLVFCASPRTAHADARSLATQFLEHR